MNSAGSQVLTQILAVVGTLTGVTGLVLGIVNFLRDRPNVIVSLTWDMKATRNPSLDPRKTWGLVTVGNTGRRPIFISHVSLKLPKGFEHTHLVLADGLAGQRLGEGDPPATFMVDQEGMDKYREGWHKIRAVVYDLGRKGYYSKRPKKAPSWAA